ncbi:MAG: heme-binding protein [Alphaproteobacteria bacterium]|nr:heme-binding protein [Alphaproteobacteria bacterium]
MGIAVTAGIIVIVGVLMWGPIASNVEQARYEVMRSENNVEIRNYPPLLVAEATTTGDRDTAIGEGFKLLAGYIFGDNTAKDKIAMTAPVTQQNNEKIAMTAPVMQQSQENSGENLWHVQFVMPSKYNLQTIPKPNNDKVHLRETSPAKFAVIRFSGRATPENLAEHEQELKAYLQNRQITPKSAPIYAFYNPPWTVPFLRRNEIMIEIANFSPE